MRNIERSVSDITAAEREVFERITGQKINSSQRILIKVLDKIPAEKIGEECYNHRPRDNQAEWDFYSEVSSDESAKAELEEIILDWASSSRASDNEVAEVRSLLFEHSYLLDFEYE